MKMPDVTSSSQSELGLGSDQRALLIWSKSHIVSSVLELLQALAVKRFIGNHRNTSEFLILQTLPSFYTVAG